MRASEFNYSLGNRKRHSTPLTLRARKIKRITFEGFCQIKALLGKLERPHIKRKRIYSKKKPKIYKLNNDSIDEHKRNYEPSNAINSGDNLYYSWRRVIAWEKYINDPLENKKGQHKFSL